MEEKLSIGAVSRLTGVAQHTLRKWESRHGIGIPERSDTGRRVYNRGSVDQLKAIRTLLSEGHSLAHLTGKNLGELQEMLGEHQELLKEHLGFEKVVALTEMNALELRKLFGAGAEIEEATLSSIADARVEDNALVVVEQASLLVEEAESLVEVLGPGRKLVVCAKYLSRRAQTLLRAGGAQLVGWPLTKAGLEQQVSLEDLSNDEGTPRTPMFSGRTLKKLMAMNPSLDCECPNHIAKLLLDIAAFEDYCKACEDSDPLQKRTHMELAKLTGLARMKLEEGMLEVARADNIDLSMT